MITATAPRVLTRLLQGAFDAFPQTCAIREGDVEVTYRQLEQTATTVAAALADREIEPGDRVVIYSRRTAQAIASMVGIWKAGAVVVPVSLDTPPLRLAGIAEDAGAALILTDASGREALGDQAGYPLLDLSTVAVPGAAGLPAVEVSSQDLAYVIYTSGTSGRPKGVMIEHGSICVRFRDWDERYGLTRKPLRILQVSKLGFDVFTGDVVKALGSGGTLVLCPEECVLDPHELYRMIVANAIDYLDVVPGVVRLLVEMLEESGHSLESLSMLNCGADRWSAAEYRRFRKVTRVAHLFNSYGVTECTVESTVFEDDGSTLDRKQTLPIGSVLGSDRLLIVDEALQPVPSETIGQICIGGPCVARGYVNRPDLDTAAFFERCDPDAEPVRFYKTGDLGRMDAHGVVEFLGRMDSQIKIRGQRIEPAEIERVLESLPGIARCAVCFDAAQEQLVAFVRMQRGVPFKQDSIIRELGKHLTPAMVPARFVPMMELPMSVNGKVDTRRLLEWVPRRYKVSHDLYLARSVAELQHRLAGHDIDIPALTAEFVKPGYHSGVLVAGSLADGVGTAVSDLDLLVLLDRPEALKKLPQLLCAAPVHYLPVAAAGDTQASLFLNGIEIDLQLVVDPTAAAGVPAVARGGDGQLSVESGLGVKFLSKLSSDWVVQGPQVVERWQRYYCIEQFRLQRILLEFTAASKNLEDLGAGVGLEPGHVGVLGINVVASLLRGVLYFNGYRGLSRMWMRVLGRMLETADEDTCRVLREGRSLMFPGLLPTAEAESGYCRSVHALWNATRALLVRDSDLQPVIESILHRFDVSPGAMLE